MDLVRNNIFHRAESQGENAQVLFEEKWRLLDGPFWKADSPRAKPRRPRIDHFLSHALTAQTGNEISVRELYGEYRAFIRPQGRPRFKTVEEELDALLKFAPIYKSLEDSDASSIGRLGVKLQTWEVATAYPLVFAVAASDVDDLEKDTIYQLIYSYLVRRALCGLTPKSLNKTFPRIIFTLLKDGVSRDSFAKAFASQTGPAVRFPGDEEVRKAIAANPVYNWFLKKDRLTDILWELELKSRTKFSVSSPRPSFTSIEHILPQSWAASYPLLDERMAPADYVTGADESMLAAITSRNAFLHTLGNLTLITISGNSAASNSAFPEKKRWLQKSLLALRGRFERS